MHIVHRKREFWQQVQSCIPSKQSRLFSFGYETLVGAEIRSTRANARRSPHLWSTAKAKMGRLLGNERVTECFPALIRVLAPVSPDDVIAVDFSDFKDGRQVLMFAKQTNQGRAVPLYFEILEYPVKKHSQNTFVIEAIERFVRVVEARPLLVFDRGFACPAIVKHLATTKHPFIIRIKKRKRMEHAGVMFAAEDASSDDIGVHAYGRVLRLVISDHPKNGNDPWYLITNDTTSAREEVINRYYHRFEIEEFFRDAKRLLRLEWVHMRTVRGLTILLWFSILTNWLFAHIVETLTPQEHKERIQWQVSLFRYVLEKFEQELLASAYYPPSGAVLWV